MNLKDALQRIEVLEARVKELEARPPAHYHMHYTAVPPVPVWREVSPWMPYTKSLADKMGAACHETRLP